MPVSLRDVWQYFAFDNYNASDLTTMIEFGALFQSARVSPAPLEFVPKDKADNGKPTFRFQVHMGKDIPSDNDPPGTVTTGRNPTLEKFAIVIMEKRHHGDGVDAPVTYELVNYTPLFSRQKADAIDDDFDEDKYTYELEMTEAEFGNLIGSSDVESLYWAVLGGMNGDDFSDMFWSDILSVKTNTAPKVNQGAANPKLNMSGPPGTNNQTNTFPVSTLLANASDPDTGAMGLGGVAIVGVDTSVASIEYRNSTDEAFQELEIEGLGEENAVTIRQEGEIRITTNTPFFGRVDEILDVVAVDKTFEDWGEMADVSERGGSTSFSEATSKVDLTVTPQPIYHELTAANDGVQVSGQSTQEVSDFGSSRYPSSAFDGAGNSLAVWEGDGPSGYGVYGRMYNADGSPRTATMLLNEQGVSAYYPSVAMDNSGYSVALWTQNDSFGQMQLFARAFDPQGTAIGGAFQVSDYAGSTMGPSTIVANDYGQYLAVWSGYNSADYSTHVYARRLYAGGVSGSQMQIDSGSSTSNYISYSARAAGIDNSGNAVAGWLQYDANWNPQSVVRRLDAYDMLGSEIVVSSQASYSGGGPAVAVAEDGRFAAAWDAPASDWMSSHVFVQLFDAWGNTMAIQQVDDPNYPGNYTSRG